METLHAYFLLPYSANAFKQHYPIFPHQKGPDTP